MGSWFFINTAVTRIVVDIVEYKISIVGAPRVEQFQGCHFVYERHSKRCNGNGRACVNRSIMRSSFGAFSVVDSLLIFISWVTELVYHLQVEIGAENDLIPRYTVRFKAELAQNPNVLDPAATAFRNYLQARPDKIVRHCLQAAPSQSQPSSRANNASTAPPQASFLLNLTKQNADNELFSVCLG